MEKLGLRLRALRLRNRYSLDHLANLTGLTKSFLSKLERGVSTPSISTVLKLSEAYAISLSEIVGDQAKEGNELVSVVRASDRMPLDPGNDKGRSRYEAIVGARASRVMDPFIVHPPREYEAISNLSPHQGEEFVFVVGGKIEIIVGDTPYELAAGDAISFDSAMPHRMKTIGKSAAEVLVVTAPFRDVKAKS